MKKVFYMIVGSISLVLGTIGVFFPILPTVPFYLLTGFCYARASERLHQWFLHTKLYQKHLASFVQGAGMKKSTKIRIMVTVTCLLTISCILMRKIWIGQVCILVIWVAHIWYFTCKVKTIED